MSQVIKKKLQRHISLFSALYAILFISTILYFDHNIFFLCCTPMVHGTDEITETLLNIQKHVECVQFEEINRGKMLII